MYKLPMCVVRVEQFEGESSNYHQFFLPNAKDTDDAYEQAKKVLEGWWEDDTEVRDNGYWRGDDCAYVKLSSVQQMETLDDIVNFIGWF